MKKIFSLFIQIFFIYSICYADSITLSNPETLSIPTAAKISEWEIIKINAADKIMRVRYKWIDANGDEIIANGNDINIWTCSDTCFDDVFSFQIRSQDVGTSIGHDLRKLIWNRMKADILSGSNDGAFE